MLWTRRRPWSGPVHVAVTSMRWSDGVATMSGVLLMLGRPLRRFSLKSPAPSWARAGDQVDKASPAT